MAESTVAPVGTLGHVMRRCSTTGWGAAGWHQGLAAVIAAIIFWPQASVNPAVGLDPSWQAGLALARVRDLAWGPDVLFTYGPLGFLQTTAYYSFDQSVLATIYQPIVVAALFLGIAAALRQGHAPITSLIVAFVTTGVITILCIGHGGAPGMMYPELALLASFAWATVPLLQHDPKWTTVFITCVVLGGVAGFQLLLKFNTGLEIAAIALALSVLLGWRAVGRHCATMTAFAASTLVWWMLAGQRPGDLPGWLRSSANLVAGYSEAMAMPLPPYAFLAVPALVLALAWIGALCIMLARGGQQTSRRFVVLTGLATVMAAKSAFGRFDLPHFNILLGLIVVAGVITALTRTRRRAFVVAAVAVVVVSVGIGIWPAYYFQTLEALQGPVQAVDRVVTLGLPGRVAERVEQAKARQRALYAIPDRFIKTIGSSTVHIDPDEISAAWAYDLAWRPAPVFQTYQANTPRLDGLNSKSLAEGQPQFVLSRRPPATPSIGIDGRLGVQESPRYSRSLLCNYTMSGVENGWALFTHTSPHCGPLTPLSQGRVHANDLINVPAPSRPDAAVLVAIDLEPTLVDRLFQGTVAPLSIPTVMLDGVTYRLIAANAAEPFLVTTPTSVNGTNLQIQSHTVSVGRTPSLGQGDVVAGLRFYEMRVEP
ncbi:hypothetical protein ACKUVQ_12305 [Mycobacterium seoulense]|uniref:hypothetical protein n=1 Tax=Mycobacterium seoulense TaxID=386911 RepID=UPI003CE8E882